MIPLITRHSSSIFQEESNLQKQEIDLLVEKIRAMAFQVQNTPSSSLNHRVVQAVDKKIAELDLLIQALTIQKDNADLSDQSKESDFSAAEKNLKSYIINGHDQIIGISFESFSLTSQEYLMLAKELWMHSPSLFFHNLSAFRLEQEGRFCLAQLTTQHDLLTVDVKIALLQSLSLTPLQFLELVEINPTQLAPYMQIFRVSQEDAFERLKKDPKNIFPYFTYPYTQEQFVELINLLLERAPQLLIQRKSVDRSFSRKISLNKELYLNKDCAHLFVDQWIEKKKRERQALLFNRDYINSDNYRVRMESIVEDLFLIDQIFLDYPFTEDEKIVVLKRIAEEIPEKFSKQRRWFDLTFPHIFSLFEQLVEKGGERLEVCKIQEGSDQLIREKNDLIENLGMIDTLLDTLSSQSFFDEKLRLAKQLINIVPIKLIESIKRFKFDQNTRFDFAKEIALKEGLMLVNSIENFDLTDSQKITLAHILLDHNPKDVSLERFFINCDGSIFDREMQFDLAQKIALKKSENIDSIIKSFNLTNPQKLIIADILLNHHPDDLIHNIRLFPFETDHLWKLADHFLETDPEALIRDLSYFKLTDEMLGRYAETFQKKIPDAFLSWISSFHLSQAQLFEIAKEKIVLDPKTLLNNIHSFSLTQEQSVEIFELLKPKASDLNAFDIEKLKLDDETFLKAAKEVLYRCESFVYLPRLSRLTPDDLLECAEALLLYNPKILIANLSSFKIPEEQLRISQLLQDPFCNDQPVSLEKKKSEKFQSTLAERLLKADPEACLTYINHFSLSKQMQYLILYKFSPDYPHQVGNLIEIVCRSSPKESQDDVSLALAYEIMCRSPEALAKNIARFWIKSDCEAEETITIESLAGFEGEYTHVFVEHFNQCRSRKIFLEKVAKTLRKKCPHILIDNIHHFPVSKQWLNDFGLELEAKYPAILAKHLSFFDWTESQIMSCAKRVVSRTPLASNMCIQSGKIINSADQDYLHLIELFCHPLESLPLYDKLRANIKSAADAGRYPLQHPFLSDLAKQALKIEGEGRSILLLWLFQLQSLEGFKGSSFIEDGREVLEELFNIHSPSLRYQLSFLLSNIFENREYVECLKSKPLKDILFSLVLTPLIADNPEGKEDLLERVKILNGKEYKDVRLRKIVFNACFALLIKGESLTTEEKKRLINVIFPLEKIQFLQREKQALGSTQRQKKDPSAQGEWERRASAYKQALKEMRDSVSRGFHLTEALCQMSQWELLKVAVSVEDLEMGVQRTLTELMDVGEVDGVCDKYLRSFGSSNDPTTIFTYATKLNQMQEGEEKKEVLNALKRFVRCVLDDSLASFRYQEVFCNDHLSTLFRGRQEVKENWMRGEKRLFQELIQETDQAGSVKQVDIHQFLQDRICLNRHIAKDKLPFLFACLQNRLSIEEAKNGVGKNLPIHVAELGLISLLDNHQSFDQKHQVISSYLTQDIIEKAFASEEQFKRDVEDLLSALSQPINHDKRDFYEGWTVEDTDDWHSFLRCGTDVMGSCQSIHGSANLNKALLGYALDGKNRLIVVKNKHGMIVARSVIRMLWDKESEIPVLFVEYTYSQPYLEEIVFKVLNRMCVERAAALKLPLLTKAEDSNLNAYYPHTIYSLNGKAPFEYVDASDAKMTNGKYDILSPNYFNQNYSP